ncbi:MAG: hypothetical protein NT069_04600 [Planctomycetota bacterium]|nr:hypothetical protein [Planctomycetota bacterium]
MKPQHVWLVALTTIVGVLQVTAPAEAGRASRRAARRSSQWQCQPPCVAPHPCTPSCPAPAPRGGQINGVQCPKSKFATFVVNGTKYEQWECDVCGYNAMAENCNRELNAFAVRNFPSGTVAKSPCADNALKCRSCVDCVCVVSGAFTGGIPGALTPIEFAGLPAAASQTAGVNQLTAAAGYRKKANSEKFVKFTGNGKDFFAKVYVIEDIVNPANTFAAGFVVSGTPATFDNWTSNKTVRREDFLFKVTAEREYTIITNR